jgi:hypothetical protein
MFLWIFRKFRIRFEEVLATNISAVCKPSDRGDAAVVLGESNADYFLFRIQSGKLIEEIRHTVSAEL